MTDVQNAGIILCARGLNLIREGEKCRQYFCEAYEGFFQYALVRMESLLEVGNIAKEKYGGDKR